MAINLDKAAKNFAQNLVTLRKKKNLSQHHLAKVAGMTRAAIAQFESGTSNPSLELLLKLSQALQVSIEELIASPRVDCRLIRAQDVAIDRRSKNGLILRKLLPDKLPATDFDELVLEPGAMLVVSPHIEGTREYFVCLRGKITIAVAGIVYQLEKGDVLSFPGDKHHSYKNLGNSTAQGISAVFFTM